jgi:TM2 domain-containing membrane protein YozV
MTGRLFIFSVMVLLLTAAKPAYTQGRTNIPEIDSLPIDDWKLETEPLSYKKAFLYSLIFPGGGQLYSRHYVRAGFLIGLEGLLLMDILVYKQALKNNKDHLIDLYTDSATALYSAYAASPGDSTLLTRSNDLLSKARKQLDIRLTSEDARRSEICWALGLHFYGLMDAMEIVYRSRQDSILTLSGSKAFWWGLFIPGAGQIYNRKFGKFGMLWMALGSAALSAHHRQQMVNYFQHRIHVAREENSNSAELADLEDRVTYLRKRRNQYFWGMAVLHLYSIGDAVVDAILNDFDSADKFALGPGNHPFSLVMCYRF